MFRNNYDKTYLLFNCEHPDVDILEYSTWVINVQSSINNAFQLALEYWDTNQKWFCIKTMQKYITYIGIKTQGNKHTFNYDVQTNQTHLNKHNINYPGDV